MYAKQNKQKIDQIYQFSLMTGIIILILSVPLSFVLSVSVSFENGLIENLQIIVLMFNGILNSTLVNQTSDRQIKAFNIWCAALSIFLACRELSWGRIFYQIGLEANGPVFVDMKNYIWRTEAHIFIIVYLLALTVFMFAKLPLKRMLRCKPPILTLLIMIISVILSYIGDHGIIVGKLQGQVIEEFGELAFYVLIPSLCIHYFRELEK